MQVAVQMWGQLSSGFRSDNNAPAFTLSQCSFKRYSVSLSLSLPLSFYLSVCLLFLPIRVCVCVCMHARVCVSEFTVCYGLCKSVCMAHLPCGVN